MTEEEYIEEYSYRMFKIHLGAHFKDRFLPFATIAEALSGDSKVENRSSGKVEHKTEGEKQSSSSRLPPWFRRKPGRRYNIISNEGSLNRLRRASKVWGRGTEEFHLV